MQICMAVHSILLRVQGIFTGFCLDCQNLGEAYLTPAWCRLPGNVFSNKCRLCFHAAARTTNLGFDFNWGGGGLANVVNGCSCHSGHDAFSNGTC